MTRILMLAGLLAIGLNFTACAKYESNGLVDNNCSRNGGIYNEPYCHEYTKGNPHPQ